MKFAKAFLPVLVTFSVLCLHANAQQPASSYPSTSVPRLVSFSGRATGEGGEVITGTAGITFAIYLDQYQGVPLWTETQNVTADGQGNFTVQLGAATSNGLPLDLFTTGQGRWLGMRINGGEEQPRVLLVSVPYALQAADAQTLGGLPPSAFLLAAQGASAAGSTTELATAAAPSSTAISAPAIGGTGTANYVPLWTDSADLGTSILYQTGTGSSTRIGINTTSPLFTLDVKGTELVRGLLELSTLQYATASKGSNSNALNLESSSFNSGTSKYTLNHFQWQAEPAGNDTTTPGATLNLLYGTDPAAPVETGLSLSSKGLLTFAPGQTFPGTGTITGITTASGSGLTGGVGSGNATLSLLTSCTANQILQFVGGSWSCANLSSGSGTVTSVGLSAPSSDFTVSGSPITKSGTLGLSWKVAPTNLDTASAIVKRDSNGAFSAGEITASASALNPAVTGNSTGSLGAGLYGTANASSGTGVFGEGFIGVSAIGGDIGVSGSSTSGTGVQGTGGLYGVYGEAGSTGTNWGVYGVANSASSYGVEGVNTAQGGIGVLGSGTYAGFFEGNVDVQGVVTATGPDDYGSDGGYFTGSTNYLTDGIPAYGVVGTGGNNFGNSATGGTGAYVVGGENSAGGSGGDAIIAEPGSGSAGNGYAGIFMGNIDVEGSLSKSDGSFKIDHPLDPANKYLYHSSVESPDMMNVYNGNIVLDGKGEATVELPEWFETLNRDFRYQLTCIGGFAPIYVAAEIAGNHFAIAGGHPGMKVSWQVTGIRQDPWANAHRIPVDQEKSARERGFYVHPELYGAPPEKQVIWARHPEMKRVKQDHQKQAALAQSVAARSHAR